MLPHSTDNVYKITQISSEKRIIDRKLKLLIINTKIDIQKIVFQKINQDCTLTIFNNMVFGAGWLVFIVIFFTFTHDDILTRYCIYTYIMKHIYKTKRRIGNGSLISMNIKLSYITYISSVLSKDLKSTPRFNFVTT